MNARLVFDSYGKESVRLTKVRRLQDRHELVEMKVEIELTGEFGRSYTHGDNSKVIATDSMKNTVYLLAKDHTLESPESFAFHLAKHFVATYAQVGCAEVYIDQSVWRRIEVEGTPHPTAFEGGGAELRKAKASCSPAPSRDSVHGGLSELLLLKTTDSAFTGFVRDEFTALPEATDRILATKVEANWMYSDTNVDFNAAFARIRAALLGTFADHKSQAVQQTLFEMASAALAVEPSLDHIDLRMPNKHRVPFNFKPFGKEFNNDVYITTDEPSGMIHGLVHREKS